MRPRKRLRRAASCLGRRCAASTSSTSAGPGTVRCSTRSAPLTSTGRNMRSSSTKHQGVRPSRNSSSTGRSGATSSMPNATPFCACATEARSTTTCYGISSATSTSKRYAWRRDMATADLTGEVTELLQELIRNRCVNDGTPASGHEVRSVDLLESYLRFPGAELKRYEPMPGRASLVLRIPGSDPRAPTLHFMGHTDVVPVTPSGWRHDPFAGELIGGEVWGRGAVDMLDITSSMAVAMRRLLTSDFRPKGTLIYSAVADEEAMGTFGAQWLVENAWDDVRCEYLVTEFGGARLPLGGPLKLPIMTAEKGSHWVRLRVRGTPGHGSMPYQSDNALVKAAELVTRISRYKAPLRLSDLWKRFIAGLELAPPVRIGLSNPATFDIALDRAPDGAAAMFY